MLLVGVFAVASPKPSLAQNKEPKQEQSEEEGPLYGPNPEPDLSEDLEAEEQTPLGTEEDAVQDPSDAEEEPPPNNPFLHYGFGFGLQTLSKSRTLGYTILEERYEQPFISSVPVFVEFVLGNRVGFKAEVLFPSRLVFLNADALATKEHTYTFYYKLYLARQYKDPKDASSGLQSFGLNVYYQRHFGALYEQLIGGDVVPLNRQAYGAGASVQIDRLGVALGLGPEILKTVRESQDNLTERTKTFLTLHLNVYWVFSL